MSIRSASQSTIDSFVLRRTLLPAATGGGAAALSGGMIFGYTQTGIGGIDSFGGQTKNGETYFGATTSSNGYRLEGVLINSDATSVLWHRRRDSWNQYAYASKNASTVGRNASIGNNVFYSGITAVLYTNPDYQYGVFGYNQSSGTSFLSASGYFGNSSDNTFFQSVTCFPGSNDMIVSGHCYLPGTYGGEYQPPMVVRYNNGSRVWSRINAVAQAYTSNVVSTTTSGGGTRIACTQFTSSDSQYRVSVSKLDNNGDHNGTQRFYVSGEENSYHSVHNMATDGTSEYVVYSSNQTTSTYITKLTDGTANWTKKINGSFRDAFIEYDNFTNQLIILSMGGRYLILNVSDGSVVLSRKMLTPINLRSFSFDNTWLYFHGYGNDSNNNPTYFGVKIPKNGSQQGTHYFNGLPFVFLTDNLTVSNASTVNATTPNSWQNPSWYSSSPFQSYNTVTPGTLSKAGI